MKPSCIALFTITCLVTQCAIGFCEEAALDNLEIQLLGKKYNTHPKKERIERLEQMMTDKIQGPSSRESTPFRMARLYALQQAPASSYNKKAAVQFYNNAVDEAQKKNTIKAMEFYRKAILLDPKLVPAYNNLAALLDNQQKFEEAIRIYQQALSLNPDDPYLHRNLGVAFEKTGQVEQALIEYKAYLESSPSADPPIQALIENYEASRKLGSASTDYVALTDQVTGGERLLWPKKINPVRVYVQMDRPGEALFLKEVQKAFDTWNVALKGRLKLVQTGLSDEANIHIAFKNGPLSHPFLDVGHANFKMEDPREKDKMKINITVNIGEEGDTFPLFYRRQQVGRLVLHELGHAIGIWGHSPDPKDIMFTHPMVDVLSVRDVLTVQRLYGAVKN